MIGKDEERGWLRGGLAARLVWRVSGAAGGRDMIFGRRPLAAIVCTNVSFHQIRAPTRRMAMPS